MQQVRPLLDGSIALARATGDSIRLAGGLAGRGWLALRSGDLGAAEADARTRPCGDRAPAPAIYRVMNAGLLIKTQVLQGELDAAERTLAPLELEAEGDRSSPQFLASHAAGCGSHRDAWPKASRTSWPSGSS